MAAQTGENDWASCDYCHQNVPRDCLERHLTVECDKVDILRVQTSEHTPKSLPVEDTQCEEMTKKLQNVLHEQRALKQRIQEQEQTIGGLQDQYLENRNEVRNTIRKQPGKIKQEQIGLLQQYDVVFKRQIQRLSVETTVLFIALSFAVGLILGCCTQVIDKQEAVLFAQIQKLEQRIEWRISELKNSTKESNRQLKEKLEEQRNILSDTIRSVDIYMPPYTLTIVRSRKLFRYQNLSEFSSPPLYTHLGGYMFQLKIVLGIISSDSPDVLEKSLLIVFKVVLLKGNYDSILKFPISFNITIELLNQLRDQDHYVTSIECDTALEKKMTSPTSHWLIDAVNWFIESNKQSHVTPRLIGFDLNSTNMEENQSEIEYVKNNSLQLRIANIFFTD